MTDIANPIQLTIVIPTYNERDNVHPMVDAVSAALTGIDFDIVFVDDNSPDGTAHAVREICTSNNKVQLLLREDRRGLAGACIEGILMARAPVVAVLDSDMQHDERCLAEMYQKITEQQLDLVVGTRFGEQDTHKEGLSLMRSLGSQLATSLTRMALRINISDPMSGFFMVRRSSFIPLAPKLHTDGFKILSDTVAASKGKWNIAEVSYHFRPRERGESKMDSIIAVQLLGMLLSHLSFGVLSLRFVLFCLVGFTGIGVQLAGTWLAFSFTETFAWAQTCGVLAAMTSNFLLNNMLTYRDRMLRGWRFGKGLLVFYLICSAGAIANIAVADLVYDSFGYWLTASLAGSLMSALWNFFFNNLFTWKVR